MSDLALDGVRVVEAAEWLFVPSAGALLADWGADVVHVERLDGGDPFRGNLAQGIGHSVDGVDLNMAMANRGKRSLGLDLRNPRGKEVLHRLLESADVFLTNFRPGALARLDLDAETLTSRYPGLVYARGNGYGTRGPDADEGGYDASAYWSRGGLARLMMTTDMEYPLAQRPGIGDRSAGMALAFGVAAALVKRMRTGRGSVVEVSLLATAMLTLSTDVMHALAGHPPESQPGRAPMVNPLAGIYRTADGRHLQIAFLQGDRYWTDFCRLMGRDDLAADPRFVDLKARMENSAACVAELDAEFARRTFDEWRQLLARFDAPWAPVQRIAELLEDPQVVANEYVGDVVIDGEPRYRLPRVPVQFDGRPPELRRAPEHGEHTEEILGQLGYGWDAIEALKEAGAVL